MGRMTRRRFLQYSGAALASLALGDPLSRWAVGQEAPVTVGAV